MSKTAPVYRKVLILFLTLGFLASLGANLYWYNSNSGKLKDFSYQQYNQVLLDYENNILSTSQSILSILENAMVKQKINREELLDLYTSYKKLNEDQIQYANYVQSYNSPEGKEAVLGELKESVILNYVPGFVYFNSSITLFKELLLQNDSDSEVEFTNDLEKCLQLAVEIIQVNMAIYEKFINEESPPLSDEAIVIRVKLQKDLTASFAKLVELDTELSRLSN